MNQSGVITRAFVCFGALSVLSAVVGVAAPVADKKAPMPLPSPLPPSSIRTTLLPEWDAQTGPVELPDLTLNKDEGIKLTLDKSIDLAILGATHVLKAENQVKYSGAALLQAYGRFLPNLTVAGNYGLQSGNSQFAQNGIFIITSSSHSAGFTIASTLNLFNGLADYDSLRGSLLRQDAAEMTLVRAKQEIALDVAQSFLQVVLDGRIVEIARKNLRQSRAREHLLTEQTRVGARNLSDLFRQQAQTSSDEAMLLSAQNRTRTDQIMFLRRIRADVAKNYHFVEPLLPQGKVNDRFQDEAALLMSALEKRTDLKALGALADAATWDLRSNRSGYLPKLDLVGSAVSAARTLDSLVVNGNNQTPAVQSNPISQLGGLVNYTATLNLTWSLFDRLSTYEQVARAKNAAENARIDAQDRFNQVEGDVRQAFGNYRTAIQQLESSRKGLEAAQKAYEVVEGRYEVGSANFVDLTTAQATLVQVETTRAQSLIDFELQSRQMEFAIGETHVE